MASFAALELHWELLTFDLPDLFDRAQQIGRLAFVSRGLLAGLRGPGKLRVRYMKTNNIQSLVEGLCSIQLSDLESLRIDFSAGNRAQLCRQELERAIRYISDCLVHTSSLRVLSVRLACFDASMERLRLSAAAWEAFVSGLSSVAKHQRLTSLELTSFAIKAQSEGRTLRRALSAPERPTAGTIPVSHGGFTTTFLEALSQITTLEELVLTSDEIFAPTAQLFPQVFSRLPHLKKVDLTRNYISRQVMQVVRESLPPKAELHGDNKQTHWMS